MVGEGKFSRTNGVRLTLSAFVEQDKQELQWANLGCRLAMAWDALIPSFFSPSNSLTTMLASDQAVL